MKTASICMARLSILSCNKDILGDTLPLNSNQSLLEKTVKSILMSPPAVGLPSHSPDSGNMIQKPGNTAGGSYKPVGMSLLPCCHQQEQGIPRSLQLIHGSLKRDCRQDSTVGPHMASISDPTDALFISLQKAKQCSRAQRD